MLFKCLLQEVNLSSIDLSFCDFTGVEANKSRFFLTELKDAKIKESQFVHCDFQNANFTGASLIDSKFIDSDMRWISAKCADFRGSTFEGVDLRGADLSSSGVEGVEFKDSIYDSTTHLPASITEAQLLLMRYV
jgi:uncharacterized protein YjbI with pentapeptide repeats